MAAKEVKFNTDARDKMLRGINKLADAVRITPRSKRTKCCFRQIIRSTSHY